MTLLNTIIGMILFLLGAVIQRFYTGWNTNRRKKAEQELELSTHIECEECDMEYLKDEWQTTIETQMHFGKQYFESSNICSN